MERFFDEENGRCAGESRHELLWPLPYEVPAQVALDDKRMIANDGKFATGKFRISGHWDFGEV